MYVTAHLCWLTVSLSHDRILRVSHFISIRQCNSITIGKTAGIIAQIRN